LYKILAVAGDDLAAGFALAGIDVYRAPDAAAARDALLNAMKEDDYGLVIVEESIMSELDDRTRTAVSESNIPVVISVPGEMKWRDVEETGEDDYVAGLIRRAVGYQLDIQL